MRSKSIPVIFLALNDGKYRGMMLVRVMEWQWAVTERERQAEKREKQKKNRECDSSDNIHIRDKILEYVTNWGWGAGAKKGDRESEKMDAFNKQKCKC